MDATSTVYKIRNDDQQYLNICVPLYPLFSYDFIVASSLKLPAENSSFNVILPLTSMIINISRANSRFLSPRPSTKNQV